MQAKFLFRLFIALMLPITGRAQNLPDTLKNRNLSDSVLSAPIALKDVEVHAFYNKLASKRFPGGIYLLNPDQTDLKDPININGLLNKLPSVFSHTGTAGTSRVTIRGIGTRSLYGTRKINAYLNDIPITTGGGDTYFDDIDMADISNIEIIGTPASGVYGPALGGTILLTSEPQLSVRKVSVNSTLGSYGLLKYDASANFGTTGNSTYVSIRNINSAGYRENNEYKRNSFFLNHQRFGKRSDWEFLLMGSIVKDEIPSSIDSLTLANKPRAAAANWLKTNGRENNHHLIIGITNRTELKSAIKSNLTVYGNFKKSEEVRPFNFLYEDNNAVGAKLYLSWNPQKANGLTILSGISGSIEQYIPTLFENTDGLGTKGNKTGKSRQDIYMTSTFLMADYKPNDKHYLSVGLTTSKYSFSNLDYFITPERKEKYDNRVNVSPRIAYSFALTNQHYVFGTVSHGFSYPALDEVRYSSGAINDSILPEHAWCYEIGTKGTFRRAGIHYSIAAYYMPVYDLIVPKRIAEDSYIGSNAGKTSHQGLELSLSGKLPISLSPLLEYRISATLNNIRFVKFEQDGISYDGNMLPGVPSRRYYGWIRLNAFKTLFWESEVHYVGKMAMNDLNSRYTREYLVYNMKAGFHTGLINHMQLQAALAVFNVSNEKYASMILINAPSSRGALPRYYYPALPRNYTFEIKMSYTL